MCFVPIPTCSNLYPLKTIYPLAILIKKWTQRLQMDQSFETNENLKKDQIWLPSMKICVKRNVLAHRNDLTHTNKTNWSKL